VKFIVDGPLIASEHLLVVALVLECIILVTLIAAAVVAIRADKAQK
jgi:hypothetical protein